MVPITIFSQFTVSFPVNSFTTTETRTRVPVAIVWAENRNTLSSVEGTSNTLATPWTHVKMDFMSVVSSFSVTLHEFSFMPDNLPVEEIRITKFVVIMKIIIVDYYLSRLMTKPTKWSVCPTKTQISLGIHSVWSESSLSAWRKLGSLATYWALSEDWSDWADAQADLSLR